MIYNQCIFWSSTNYEVGKQDMMVCKGEFWSLTCSAGNDVIQLIKCLVIDAVECDSTSHILEVKYAVCRAITIDCFHN